MTSQEINRFFQVLSRELDLRARVIVTGAAAGALWGSIRPSIDIDFAIEPSIRTEAHWHRVEEAVDRTVQLTGIPAQYARDIERWGAISLMDYRRHTLPHRRFGKLTVRILDPAYWSIGKITRYLDTDIRDLVDTLSRKKISALRLAEIWGRAVRKSEASIERFEFRKQVEDFLRSYGQKIWGPRFDPEPAIRTFYRYAGLKRIGAEGGS